jgi:hypothetical protein
MGVLLRVLGILWGLVGVGIAVLAIIGAMTAVHAASGGAAYGFGVILGASLILMPVWLTGTVFFVLPGWISKQLALSRSDVFS